MHPMGGDQVYEPGSIPELLKRWADPLPGREEVSPLAAGMATELRDLNRWVHIWPHKSMNHRAEARAEASKLPNWPSGAPGRVRQENKIMVPASFSPMHQGADRRRGLPMEKHSFVLVAAMAISLVLLVPHGASADGEEVVAAGFSGQLPTSGVALALWDGGSVGEVATTDPNVVSIWVSMSGALVGYVVGAPDFANAAFLDLHPGGDVPAGTPMVVILAGEVPPPEPPPVAALGPVDTSSALGARVFDRPI